MKESAGWILFAILVLAIFTYYNKNKNTPDVNDEVKCELRDSFGRLITITGKSSDPQFTQMCQSQVNQQYYIYGYPYTFIRYWGGRHRPHHGGGHHGR